MESSDLRHYKKGLFLVPRVSQFFSDLKPFITNSDKVYTAKAHTVPDEQGSTFSIMSKEYDIETCPSGKPQLNDTDSIVSIKDDGAVPAETFVVGDNWYAKAQRLAGKFGVEQRGIERVPNNERLDAGMSQVGTMVCS